MTILDKNQTLQPPADYLPVSFVADGAYLRATYRQLIVWSGTTVGRGWNVVMIYLNDQGREVVRCITREDLPASAAVAETAVPVARRFRLWNGWLLILQGLQEMFK
jgi:hypothetical protein